MVGDGMGTAYTTGYRYMVDNPATKEVEPTVFDSLLVGGARTYPDDDTVVTDSAASATALATGTKSYNGAIGVDHEQHHLPTMLEEAKKKGWQTALVVTSQINHATPASFMSHAKNRKMYNEIADQYLDQRINGKPKADLMLGGGTDYFIREDRNLVDGFKKLGYSYVDSLESLQQQNSLPLLGLFGESGMTSALDAEDPLRLKHMTQKALQLLTKSDKPFFLLIEGSQIDWCGHANDVACAMAEMNDFGETMKIVKAFAQKHGDTLVVATADHNTGGLSLGANKVYQWETQKIAKIKATIAKMTKEFAKAKDINQAINKWIGFELAKDDIEEIVEAKKSGDEEDLYEAIGDAIDKATYTGWTTGGHTADDVQVFATGPGRDAFIGHQNNTEIADKLFKHIK